MRRHLLLSLIAALAMLIPVLPAAAQGGRVDVIVVLDGADAADVASDHAAQVSRVYSHAIDGFAASVPSGRLRGLERDPRVQSVELDVTVTTMAQTVPTGIPRISADDNTTIAIDGVDTRVDVDVAVLDTGVDSSHPDLNVVAETNCARRGPSNSTCFDGDASDGDSHGTHVAGTIGALDNDLGVVGVAPGARIHAVKVLGDNGSGYLSWIIAGIDWVTARADVIEVANMSLGFRGSSSALDAAISNSVAAGVTYAVSAGNDALDAAGSAPASNPDVITVSALSDFDGAPGGAGSPTCRADEDDTLANFSNFGAAVEVTAPGVCILSTIPGGGYASYSGTSMASPHVAGAAALLAASNPSATPASILSELVSTGKDDWTDESGDGILEPRIDVGGGSFSPTMLEAPTDGGGGGDGGDGGGDPSCPPGKAKKGLC